MNVASPIRTKHCRKGFVDKRVLSRKGNRSLVRSGVAAVELAIVLPLLLTLVLGSMEVCQRLFLRQSAVLSAYEGGRLAARKSSSALQVAQRCEQILEERSVVGAQVIVTPTTFAEISVGDEVSVEIRIPWAANSATRLVLKDQGVIVVRSTMLRE